MALSAEADGTSTLAKPSSPSGAGMAHSELIHPSLRPPPFAPAGNPMLIGGLVSGNRGQLLAGRDGRVMTTDLGHDTLRIWNYGPGTGLVADHEVVLPYGSGPRHMVEHPSGSVFIVSEYSVEVFVVRPEAGTYELVFRGPATAGGSQEGASAAEICLGPQGNFAYAGVRGSNVISVLEVAAGGTELIPVKDIDSGGNWPRHHLVRGSWLHVAHERSDNIATFELDPVTGLPGPMLHNLPTPSPTALVPAGMPAAAT